MKDFFPFGRDIKNEPAMEGGGHRLPFSDLVSLAHLIKDSIQQEGNGRQHIWARKCTAVAAKV